MGAQQHAQQDRDEEDDAGWDLGVRAERGDGVGGTGDQRRHHQQRQLGGSSAPSERRVGALDDVAVLDVPRGRRGVGHGPLVVVAPLGAPAPAIDGGGSERRGGRGGRRGRGRGGGAAVDELEGLVEAVEARFAVDGLGDVGIEVATLGSGGVLGGRVDPQHPTGATLVDDRLVVVVERHEPAAARPGGEHHERDHQDRRNGEGDGQSDDRAPPARGRRLAGRRRSGGSASAAAGSGSSSSVPAGVGSVPASAHTGTTSSSCVGSGGSSPSSTSTTTTVMLSRPPLRWPSRRADRRRPADRTRSSAWTRCRRRRPRRRDRRCTAGIDHRGSAAASTSRPEPRVRCPGRG